MGRTWTRLLFLLLAGATLALLAWLVAPKVFDLLPGQIRARLPEEFVALVTTPLPTALPEPLRPSDVSLLDASFLATPTATLEPTPTATPTTKVVATIADLAPTSTPTPSPTATPSPTPTPTAIPLPNLVRLEGLKNTPQKYNNCGPANLAIVLNHYDHQVNQLEIGEALKPNYEDRNVSPHELVNYVMEETELQARAIYGLELEALKRLLAADFPVIVEKGLELDTSHGWMGHYLTLFGYDEQEGVFFGLDTFLGPWDGSGKSFEYAELDELWAQFNHVAIVVYRDNLESQLDDVLGSQSVPEEMWQAAADRARAALVADVDDAFAWFDLGSSLFHMATLDGDDALFAQAAVAFDRAREIGLPWRTLWYQFEPYQAYLAAGRFDEVLALTEAVMTTSGGRNIEETHLYRGHALLASGDPDGAQKEYERALRLNPGSDAAQEALQALTQPENGAAG